MTIAARHVHTHREDGHGAEPTAAKGGAGWTHRGNDENRKSRCVGRGSRPGSGMPVDRAERVPCQRLQGEELRGDAQIPRPPETGATRIGRSKPPNWIRQERQAIPDRKGQKLGGVQPIHQARRCAPSLGGASSPRGACAPGAFSLEIDLPNWTVGLEAWRSASEPPARLCAVTIPIECSELNKKENGVGWRRIRQRRQSKKPNQINDKCRKSSTGQHVAHVRGAHDGLD